MEIAIRGQRDRLEKLKGRIETRQQELELKAQVVSRAPEIECVCLALPV